MQETTEKIAEKTAEDFAQRAENHGINLFSDDRQFNRHREDLPSEIVLLTGDSHENPGEIVVIDSSYHKDREWFVTLRYPERPGNYQYDTSADSFFSRVEADGGWYEVPVAAWKPGATICPDCGSFMEQNGGRQTFDGWDPSPTAECKNCHTSIGLHQIQKQDRVVIFERI